MSKLPDWLPLLVQLEEFQGQWAKYVQAIYAHFKSDFICSKPNFRNKPVNIKRHPLLDGKEACFWHITSEGTQEDQREPDTRRCERIRWPRPIIEHCDDEAVKCWQNRRGRDDRTVLWLSDQDYVVVLADRGKYVLLWTAYCVSYKHTREKLLAEYLQASK